MMSNDNDFKDVKNAELLLPWYVAGTLSTEDTQKVETWLHENPEAQAHLARAQEELDTVITASEAIPMPRADAVNDLMAAIGADAPHTNPTGFIERIWQMLSPRYAMAGAAALALVVLVQAGAIGLMVNNDQSRSFEIASESPAISIGPTALIAFQDDVPLATITTYLSTQNLTIVDGPKPGGIFTIAAPDTDEGAAALEKLGADQTLVRFFTKANQ